MNRHVVYGRVTDAILERLAAGTAPWHQPWTSQGQPRNFVTGRPYSGVNAFALGIYGPTPYWLTYRQAAAMNCQVRKGTRGVPILYFSKSVREVTTPEGTEERESVLVRVYHVFNAADVDGIDTTKLGTPRLAFEPIEAAKELLGSVEPRPAIVHGGDKAAFAPGLDIVRMPRHEDFRDAESYYATLFHELTHWTGGPSRLNRESLRDARDFGDESYAKEELVAQMGAGFLCALAGIENKTIDQSASYLDNWLKVLKDDRGLLVSAASQAQKAADYLTKNWLPATKAPLQIMVGGGIETEA